jgi:hypothetical protein
LTLDPGRDFRLNIVLVILAPDIAFSLEPFDTVWAIVTPAEPERMTFT